MFHSDDGISQSLIGLLSGLVQHTGVAPSGAWKDRALVVGALQQRRPGPHQGFNTKTGNSDVFSDRNVGARRPGNMGPAEQQPDDDAAGLSALL